jgi:hypothetical protein
MTSPDPVPLPPGPLAAIVTTDGTTWSATEVTGQALRVAEAVDEREVPVEPDDCVAPTMRPPATPPTTKAAPSSAHSNHRRELREALPHSHRLLIPGRQILSGDSEPTPRRMQVSHNPVNPAMLSSTAWRADLFTGFDHQRRGR